MKAAAARLGFTVDGTRRALREANIELVEVGKNFAVDEADLVAFIKAREGYTGRGRPPKKPE